MDHMYCHSSENTTTFQQKPIMTSTQQKIANQNIIASQQHSPADTAAMALLENKQLKSMLLLHLDLIQEQSDMLMAKDKQIASLRAKLERLERRFAGLKPAQAQDENANVNSTLHATIPVSSTINAGGATRPIVSQPISRGSLMKMAALNANTGKPNVRIRPLMISLKKVVPTIVDTGQQQDMHGQTNGYSLVKVKGDQEQQHLKNSIQALSTANVPRTIMTTTTTNSHPQLPPANNIIEYCNGSSNKISKNESGSGGMSGLSLKHEHPPKVPPSATCDMEFKLKIEDSDSESEVHLKSRGNRPELSKKQSSPIKSEPIGTNEKSEAEKQVRNEMNPLITESLANPLLLTMTTSTKKRSPSECSNRAPRKYSRVMSTRKLYVSRHWEEEELEEDPNSLTVAELREGESNLEVPNWKEIDARGLDEEVRIEEAPQQVVATEDLSEAAFLKRHSKHEADERRRKKWDIQRFREQRTIEKLKKRHCKSDIYCVGGGGGGGAVGGIGGVTGMQSKGIDDAQSVPYPMSLYPSLNNIRHIETTEYLPVQAFGEPIPTPINVEFNLPWHATGDSQTSAAGSVEWMQKEGSTNGGGGGDGSHNNSKYSSFYLKQNSSLMPSSSSAARHHSSSGTSSKIRFKRIKSQSSGASSSGSRR